MGLELPVLGVGIGLRREIEAEILAHIKHIDWCEVIAEQYIHVSPDRLDQITDLARSLPIVPHGVDLSIGTDQPIEEEYLTGLMSLVDRLQAPWFTDHLCFTRVPGYRLGQLTPLMFCEEAVEVVARKAKLVKERIGRHFLLENIAYLFKIPGGSLTEAEFITEVLERADVGLLLDVCNLYLNAMNHRYDPYEFLRAVPMERVVQVHIAGGHQRQDLWLDTHSYPVPAEVFRLLEYVLAHAPVKGVLLERDANFPPAFNQLLYELDAARTLFKKYRR